MSFHKTFEDPEYDDEGVLFDEEEQFEFISLEELAAEEEDFYGKERAYYDA